VTGDDARAAREELQQFASVASHDLAEPLRMVTSYLQLLERRYADVLDDDGRQFIAFARDGAQRMRGLIDGLVEWTRVERLPLDRQPVDVRAAVDAALPAAGDADVSVPELPVIQADAEQLTQVFRHLLANAAKFRSAADPRVEISAERNGAGWRFTVADNGIGVDPGQADRIFAPFQRLHTREEYPGGGIGLAVCRRILERHGGTIAVEPNPGGGSRFVFTIPDAAADRA
jgi:light-regulated signal transduction histidine kinase (bacteriophytochrome)